MVPMPVQKVEEKPICSIFDDSSLNSLIYFMWINGMDNGEDLITLYYPRLSLKENHCIEEIIIEE